MILNEKYYNMSVWLKQFSLVSIKIGKYIIKFRYIYVYYNI